MQHEPLRTGIEEQLDFIHTLMEQIKYKDYDLFYDHELREELDRGSYPEYHGPGWYHSDVWEQRRSILVFEQAEKPYGEIRYFVFHWGIDDAREKALRALEVLSDLLKSPVR